MTDLLDLVKDIGSVHPGYGRAGVARDTPGAVVVVDDTPAEDPPEDVFIVFHHTGNATLY